MIQFVIKGETPAKKNSRINLKNGISIPSKRYRDWHKSAISQIPFITMIENPVIVKLDFVHGDLRRRDSDNGVSSILDLLVDAKVLKDDNWQVVKEIHVTNNYKKGNPEVRIELYADA